MESATKGLEMINENQYVVRFRNDAIGLITKKQRQYEAMRFGSRPKRTYHPKISGAIGTLIAERINA